MAAHLARAAALAALTSALGYAAYRYRKRGSEARADRLALQAWETDGGNSSKPGPRRASSRPPASAAANFDVPARVS